MASGIPATARRRTAIARTGAGREGPGAADGHGDRRRRRGRPLLRWPLVACLALATLSLLAPSTLSYDPWAWLVWGREVAGLDLNTEFGPSWKPLPILFTTPFSLFGSAAPALWLIVARAGALVGLLAAFRLGRRLGGPLAGALAAATLALSSGYLRGPALGYSEGILVALVLIAVERHLDGRRGQALALGFAAGLLRPETWPFLGLYALWVFVRERSLRPAAVVLMALLPVLWLGPELWGSGDALRAASRAHDPTLFSPAFAKTPWLAILRRAARIVPWPAKAGALAAIVVGAAAVAASRGRGGRRAARLAGRLGARGAGPRLTLALAACACAWLALVATMTELGYAGNTRYLAMPVALCCVLGGVGLGWLAGMIEAALERLGRAKRTRGTRLAALAAGAAGRAALAAGAAVVIASAAFAGGPLAELAGDAGEVADEARVNASLPAAIDRAGGRERVLRCGKVYATVLQVPVVAWQLAMPIDHVGIEPRAPGTLFRGPGDIQPPDAPAPPAAAGGLRPLGRIGGWRVSSNCRPTASGRQLGHRLSFAR